MTNTEYAAAFVEIILPVVTSFHPDLILIACGLDAAKGDLLGDCGLTPEMYYTMTNSLLQQAGEDIPFVAALEGGYDMKTISNCMEAVALALLDEPWSPDVTPLATIAASPKESAKEDMDIDVPSDETKEQERDHPYTPSLSRFWTHQDMHSESAVKSKTTRRAITAIKRSARALANKASFCLGHIHFLGSAHSERQEAMYKSNLSHYDQLQAKQSCRRHNMMPFNHRPHQERMLPFKKRKHELDMMDTSY